MAADEADFFPGDYDQARFSIDGRYAAGLDASSALAVWINGSLASSVPLSSAAGGVLRQQVMDVPLHFFHLGRNDVVIESTATRLGDRECGVQTKVTDARAVLSPGSDLALPAFARPGLPRRSATRNDGGASR